MGTLNNDITTTLNNIIGIEKGAVNISKRLGIDFTNLVSTTQIVQLVSNIGNNCEHIKEITTIDDNNSLQQIRQLSETVTPLMEGVSSGVEMMKDSPELVQMYRNQANEEIKKKLYTRVQKLIQQSNLQKYINQRQQIESEEIGFFGKLIGKEKLKQAKINNIDLKIQLENSKNVEVEELEKCSVRDMLSDLYGCVITNYNGDFSQNQDISQIYNSIKEVFGKGNKRNVAKPFLDEDIKRMAEDKIRMQNGQNLPISNQTKTVGIFGKTRNAIQSVEAENYQLRNSIEESSYRKNDRSTWAYRPKQNALTIFENKLKQICSKTVDLTMSKDNLNKNKPNIIIGE